MEFTRFPEKKYIIICYSNVPVSPRSFRMNPSRHCSAGSTPRGGPLLVNLFIFYYFLKKNNKKIIKKSNYETQRGFINAGALRNDRLTNFKKKKTNWHISFLHNVNLNVKYIMKCFVCIGLIGSFEQILINSYYPR